MDHGGIIKMRYIRPEIEIAEVQTEDVITLSLGDILNWGTLTEEQKSQVDIGTTTDDEGNKSGNVNVGADFFN